MATRVDLQIDTRTSADKKYTPKVSYVNPQATDNQLIAFAEALTALTTNTYWGAKTITTRDLVETPEEMI